VRILVFVIAGWCSYGCMTINPVSIPPLDALKATKGTIDAPLNIRNAFFTDNKAKIYSPVWTQMEIGGTFIALDDRLSDFLRDCGCDDAAIKVGPWEHGRWLSIDLLLPGLILSVISNGSDPPNKFWSTEGPAVGILLFDILWQWVSYEVWLRPGLRLYNDCLAKQLKLENVNIEPN
jgi:hypothetical protein